MSFESCLRDAAARGEIDNDEAESIIARFRSDARTMGREGARTKAAADMAARAAQKRRQDMLVVAAHDKMVRDIMSFRDHKGRTNLFEAGNSLFEDFGYAGFPSARFIGEALIGHFHAKMADFLDHFARKTLLGNASLTGGRMNKADLADIRRAFYGEKVPPAAQGLADAASSVFELARQLFNERAGDTIAKLDKWSPQTHNPDAVIRAGGFVGKPDKARQYWSQFIDPLLDWTKIRDPFTGELFGRTPGLERRVAILGHAWDSIVTDGRIDRAPQARRIGGPNIANSRSDHKFFFFKGADAQMTYDRQFGGGDVYTQIMDHIHGMARDIALMERLSKI